MDAISAQERREGSLKYLPSTDARSRSVDSASQVSIREPARTRRLASRIPRSPWLGVAAAVLMSVILRIPFVGQPAYPDEGGYLLAADHWHAGGSMLYGDFFVDRPPLLMLFWRAVVGSGGIETARWSAVLLVAALVVCAGWAGQLLGGGRGAVWSSFVAAALASGPILGAHEVDGELLAVPLVMLSCTMALLAVRGNDAAIQARRAALAGVTGACAVLMKQNFVDALVFAVVLVVAAAMTGSLSWRSARRVLGWTTGGVAVVAAAALMWASTTAPGPGGLLYAMYGFRSDAGHVILSHSLSAPESRLSTLVGAAALSGVLVVIVLYLVSSGSRLRRCDPVTVAIAAMLVVGLAGVGLGASYWVHYLVGLVPVVALAVGTFGGRSLPLRRVASVVAAFVVVSAVSTSVAAIGEATPTQVTAVALERMLVDASHSSDSVVITYGHANVIESSGLEPGYPYLWSLPMRTLDPQLNLLVDTLSGPSAPTWLMQWDDFNSWNIDAQGRLAAAVQANYRPVATICGVEVYLHRGLSRALPVSPDSCAQ